MIFAFCTLSQFCSSIVGDFTVSCAMLQHRLITLVPGVSKAEAGFDIDVRNEKACDLVLIVKTRVCDIFVVLLVQSWQSAPYRLENVKVAIETSASQNLIKIISYVTGRSHCGQHCPNFPNLTFLRPCLRLVQPPGRGSQGPRRFHPVLALRCTFR